MTYPPRLLRDYCEGRLPRDVARSIEIAAAFDPQLAIAIADQRRVAHANLPRLSLAQIASMAGYSF